MWMFKIYSGSKNPQVQDHKKRATTVKFSTVYISRSLSVLHHLKARICMNFSGLFLLNASPSSGPCCVAGWSRCRRPPSARPHTGGREPQPGRGTAGRDWYPGLPAPKINENTVRQRIKAGHWAGVCSRPEINKTMLMTIVMLQLSSSPRKWPACPVMGSWSIYCTLTQIVPYLSSLYTVFHSVIHNSVVRT